jgi:hypothetical protein
MGATWSKRTRTATNANLSKPLEWHQVFAKDVTLRPFIILLVSRFSVLKVIINQKSAEKTNKRKKSKGLAPFYTYISGALPKGMYYKLTVKAVGAAQCPGQSNVPYSHPSPGFPFRK